jgi:hypothetical protein
MIDALTQSVVDYQQGKVPLEEVRNRVLVEAFYHLERYRRKGEDEVSEFLLLFHGKIEGLLGRFEFRGLPFRHFLLRTLKWQWSSFLVERSRRKRHDCLVAESLVTETSEDFLAETATLRSSPLDPWTPTNQWRLILLALKAAPYLNDGQLESISEYGGVELSWLQSCQRRLQTATDDRRARRERLALRRGEAFCRRLIAEDEARREVDPDRRREHESRASLYRRRLNRLSQQQKAISPVPTHRELANLLRMPKGSVDSGLYHLKKKLSSVYSSGDDDSAGDQQPPQKEGT